jgi:hypothetical protein
VKNRRAGQKIFVYIKVTNLGDFSPPKLNFGIRLKNAQDIFKTNIWTFKVLKRFFIIWVVSTVFTVPQSTQKCTKRRTIHF